MVRFAQLFSEGVWLPPEDKNFICDFARQFPRHLELLSPKNLTCFAWASAKLGIDVIIPQLFDKAMTLVANFSAADISLFTWACLETKSENGAILQALCHRALAIDTPFAIVTILFLRTYEMNNFHPQAFASFTRAYLGSRIWDESLIPVIMSEAVVKIPHCTPAELCDLAIAFASTRIPNIPVLNALSNAAITKMQEFRPHHIIQFCSSCLQLGFLRDDVMRQVLVGNWMIIIEEKLSPEATTHLLALRKFLMTQKGYIEVQLPLPLSASGDVSLS
jgi:hypothetical protein